jgi:hypothetical protein
VDAALGLAPACVGLFLGWQAVAVLAPIVLVAYGLTRTAGHVWPAARRLGPGIWWCLATLAWILAWKTLVGFAQGS